MASVVGSVDDAPSGARSPARMEAAGIGNALAAGLCNAAGQAIPSPHEDVRAYLQGTVLPVLGPAIEKLLHHIHESGELQRALRERAAAEHEQRRRPSEHRTGELKKSDSSVSADNVESPAKESSARPRRPSIVVHSGGPDESPSSTTQTPTTQEPTSRGRRPSTTVKPEEEAAAAAAALHAAAAAQESTPTHGDVPAIVEPPAFDPLVWLSEQLRQSALGDTSHYREQIEHLVMEQISASEAAILEEGLLHDGHEHEEASRPRSGHNSGNSAHHSGHNSGHAVGDAA